MSAKLDALKSARVQKQVVRFWNPYESGSTLGFILDIGPRFFLLALIDETIRFNGFQCLRIADVRRLEAPHRYAWFILDALRKRGLSLPAKPKVDLANISALIGSASQIFPLITIHRGRQKPDSCWIGTIAEIQKSDVLMQEIGPDAVWEKRASRFSLEEITRVDFGGGYEEALQLAGGKAPQVQRGPSGR